MPTTRPSTPQQWSSDYISACSIYVNMYTKYIFVLVCYTKIGCISDIFVVALVMWYNHTWCIVCACRVYVNVFKHHFIFLFSYTVFLQTHVHLKLHYVYSTILCFGGVSVAVREWLSASPWLHHVWDNSCSSTWTICHSFALTIERRLTLWPVKTYWNMGYLCMVCSRQKMIIKKINS